MLVKVKDIKDENLKKLLLLYFSEDSEVNVSGKSKKKSSVKKKNNKPQIEVM